MRSPISFSSKVHNSGIGASPEPSRVRLLCATLSTSVKVSRRADDERFADAFVRAFLLPKSGGVRRF